MATAMQASYNGPYGEKPSGMMQVGPTGRHPGLRPLMAGVQYQDYQPPVASPGGSRTLGGARRLSDYFR